MLNAWGMIDLSKADATLAVIHTIYTNVDICMYMNIYI